MGINPDSRIGVEFYQPADAETAPSSDAVSASYLCDCSYDVIAERVLQASRLAILSLGILIYCESRSDFSLDWRSNRIHARLQLGVYPFSYFERLAKIASVPSLIYSWRIKAILRQTAPFIETPLDGGGKMLARDECKLGYEEIPETNAWEDDGGHAEYVLRY